MLSPMTPPEGPPDPRPASSRSPAPPPPDGERGLSTGARVAIGCGVVVLLGIVAVIAALAVGGLLLRDRAEQFSSGIQRQTEATETLDRLARDHLFEPPADGVVGADGAEDFFAVTDDAWDGLEEWAEEMEGLSERDGGGIADLAAGLRGVSGIARSRTVLAETLEAHEMSLGEYLWTGLALLRARRALLGPDDEDARAPPENLELARSYPERLAELSDGDGEGVDRSVVLALATWWGMSDPSSWRALGLDTLATGR